MPLRAYPPEPPDLGDDVRRLLEDLARRRPDRRPYVTGECSPLLDVLETDRSVEILVDLPGLAAESVRVLIKSGVVLIVGEKERAEPSPVPASFHLVERDFGRFARAVRLHTAVDAGRTRAVLSHGELRIALPKIDERRGRDILVTIETDRS
jgi:HSP20 family protein